MIISLALIVGALSGVQMSGNEDPQAGNPVDRNGRAAAPAAVVRVAPNLVDVAVSDVRGRSSPEPRGARNPAGRVVVSGRSTDTHGRS